MADGRNGRESRPQCKTPNTTSSRDAFTEILPESRDPRRRPDGPYTDFDVEHTGYHQTKYTRSPRQIRPWKAPGNDGISAGLMKSLGKPLREVMAGSVTASLWIGYFSKESKEANVLTLRKPGKTSEQIETVGAWRPISLLSVEGKIFEGVIQRVFTRIAEKRNLPDGQMGKRNGRSTEGEIQIIIDAVKESWAYGAYTSLLQLDPKGAFDRVHHEKLIQFLKAKRIPD